MKDMEFFIIVVPPLIGSVAMIWHLHALKKHDSVLFKFCETRRNLMSFLRQENYNLKRQDYMALRQLGNWTDKAIHYYNDGKKSMFNARRLAYEIKIMKQVDKKIKKRIIQSEEVGALYRQFGSALFSAFWAFTPFLRSEIVITLAFPILRLLARHGTRHLKAKMTRLLENISWVSNEKQAYA